MTQLRFGTAKKINTFFKKEKKKKEFSLENSRALPGVRRLEVQP